MKRTALVSVLGIFFVMDICAQDFFPKGTTWVYGYETWGTSVSEESKYVVGNDTIIGGIIYKQLEAYSKNGFDWHRINYADNQYEDDCAFREWNDSVYVYYYSHEREYLYYDFRWDDKFHEQHEVSQILLDDGDWYDYIQTYGYRLVKGIGATELFSGPFQMFSSSYGNRNCYMTMFERNGEMIYHYSVTNGIIQKDTTAKYKNTLDSNGRLHTQHYRGVEIQLLEDGKVRKVISKP